MRRLALTAALLAALTAPTAHAKLSPDTIAYWQKIHNCEQPSTWHHPGPTYPGGLGIYAPNYYWWARELGLLARYPSPSAAPILIQIRVAQWGYARHRGYWACFRVVGYPPQ